MDLCSKASISTSNPNYSEFSIKTSSTPKTTLPTMNFYLSAFLTLSVVFAQSTGFKIDFAGKDPQPLANKIGKQKLDESIKHCFVKNS